MAYYSMTSLMRRGGGVDLRVCLFFKDPSINKCEKRLMFCSASLVFCYSESSCLKWTLGVEQKRLGSLVRLRAGIRCSGPPAVLSLLVLTLDFNRQPVYLGKSACILFVYLNL